MSNATAVGALAKCEIGARGQGTVDDVFDELRVPYRDRIADRHGVQLLDYLFGQVARLDRFVSCQRPFDTLSLLQDGDVEILHHALEVPFFAIDGLLELRTFLQGMLNKGFYFGVAGYEPDTAFEGQFMKFVGRIEPTRQRVSGLVPAGTVRIDKVCMRLAAEEILLEKPIKAFWVRLTYVVYRTRVSCIECGEGYTPVA